MSRRLLEDYTYIIILTKALVTAKRSCSSFRKAVAKTKKRQCYEIGFQKRTGISTIFGKLANCGLPIAEKP